ncbi:unnamed protein product [Oreochromis niloticus]|nr:unnamed protein product [Mustela putorius furo]
MGQKSVIIDQITDQQIIITAEPGHDVTLTCRAPNNNITAVEWRRADLRDENVLLYRNGTFVTDNQHPSFKNRVDLQDRQMKDGDVSLILKNVTINDEGTYVCGVFMEGTQSSDLISIIYLIVVDPDQKIITAESGQDVTLTCRAPNNNIIVVEWSRADLGYQYKIITAESGQDVTLTCRAPNNIFSVMWSRADLADENVFLYKDGQFVPHHQHPSFKNRVDLQDRQMKDGDVSLILKNVTINDTGTYECLVAQNSNESMEVMSRSSLTVADKIITAESGQDVTLTCRATNNKITAVEWSRADLGDEHVLFYQNGRSLPNDQHPSFKNRVDLQDRQMKDGDVSLILKDVTINDTGTYECRVFMAGTNSWNNSIIIYLIVVPPEQNNITAKSGQNVTLTCRAPKNIIITGVEWNRDDLGDEYVLLYRDGHFVTDEQHPSFKNRVDLQDRQMKDGDVSLILKDVTINDTGTYECRVVISGTKKRDVSTGLISSIHLCVLPPGPSGGIIGLIVVVLLLLVGVVSFLIYRKHKVSRYSIKVSLVGNNI